MRIRVAVYDVKKCCVVNGGCAGRPVKGDVLITIVLPQNRLEARASRFKDVVVAYDGARCHRIGHGETKDRYLRLSDLAEHSRQESARVVPCSDDSCPFKCENYDRDSQFRMVKCDMSPLFGRNKREMPRVNQFAGAQSP